MLKLYGENGMSASAIIFLSTRKALPMDTEKSIRYISADFPRTGHIFANCEIKCLAIRLNKACFFLSHAFL